MLPSAFSPCSSLACHAIVPLLRDDGGSPVTEVRPREATAFYAVTFLPRSLNKYAVGRHKLKKAENMKSIILAITLVASLAAPGLVFGQARTETGAAGGAYDITRPGSATAGTSVLPEPTPAPTQITSKQTVTTKKVKTTKRKTTQSSKTVNAQTTNAPTSR